MAKRKDSSAQSGKPNNAFFAQIVRHDKSWVTSANHLNSELTRLQSAFDEYHSAFLHMFEGFGLARELNRLDHFAPRKHLPKLDDAITRFMAILRESPRRVLLTELDLEKFSADAVSPLHPDEIKEGCRVAYKILETSLGDRPIAKMLSAGWNKGDILSGMNRHLREVPRFIFFIMESIAGRGRTHRAKLTDPEAKALIDRLRGPFMDRREMTPEDVWMVWDGIDRVGRMLDDRRLKVPMLNLGKDSHETILATLDAAHAALWPSASQLAADAAAQAGESKPIKKTRGRPRLSDAERTAAVKLYEDWRVAWGVRTISKAAFIREKYAPEECEAKLTRLDTGYKIWKGKRKARIG